MSYLKHGIIILSLILGFKAHASKLFTSQEELNAAFATSVVKVFECINQNWRFVEAEEEVEFSSSRWEIDYNDIHMRGEKHKLPYLVKKKNSSVSADLKDLIDSNAVCDCRLALEVANFKALQDLVGESKFNYFMWCYEETASKVCIGDRAYNPCNNILVTNKSNIRSINKVGYFGYYPNNYLYYMVHPRGRSGGENVVTYMDSKDNTLKYIGFGPLFKQGGKTSEEVKAYLRQRFCEPTTSDKFKCISEDISRIWGKFDSLFESGLDSAMQEFSKSYYFNYEAVNKIIEIGSAFHNKGIIFEK